MVLPFKKSFHLAQHFAKMNDKLKPLMQHQAGLPIDSSVNLSKRITYNAKAMKQPQQVVETVRQKPRLSTWFSIGVFPYWRIRKCLAVDFASSAMPNFCPYKSNRIFITQQLFPRNFIQMSRSLL
jgi:hypothetical protein